MFPSRGGPQTGHSRHVPPRQAIHLLATNNSLMLPAAVLPLATGYYPLTSSPSLVPPPPSPLPRAQHFSLAGLFKSKFAPLSVGSNHGNIMRRQTSSKLGPAAPAEGGGCSAGTAGSATVPRRHVPMGSCDPFSRHSHRPPLPTFRPSTVADCNMFARKSLPMGTVHEVGVTSSPTAAPAGGGVVEGRSSSRRTPAAERKSPLSPSAAAIAAASAVTGSSSAGDRRNNVIKRSGSTQFPDSPALLGLLMRSKDSFTTTTSNGSNAVVVAPWDDDTRMLALKV